MLFVVALGGDFVIWLETIISYDSVGLVGVVLYIAAYAALQSGLVQGSGYTYTITNLLAAILVLVSLTANFNLSSAIIQITWIVISVFGLARIFFLHYSTRLNPEETVMMKSKFSSISRPLMRKFLNQGIWVDAEAGTELAIEGEPVGALIYLLGGAADVILGDKVVGTLQPDSFIGELTCFDAGPATAYVATVEKSRIFRISTSALNEVCKRNPDLKIALENAIGGDTRMKLVAANQRISGQGS